MMTQKTVKQDPGPLSKAKKTLELGVSDIRAEIVNDLGDLVFSDYDRLASLMKLKGKKAEQELEKELTSWDAEQKKKWALIRKYQNYPSLELENLVFMELQRIYLMTEKLRTLREGVAATADQ